MSKERENERKDRRQEKKILISQLLISSKVRDSRDHRVPVSLHLRLPIGILSYRHHQLLVHKEVILGDKMFLVVLSVGEDTRESVGH